MTVPSENVAEFFSFLLVTWGWEGEDLREKKIWFLFTLLVLWITNQVLVMLLIQNSNFFARPTTMQTF